MKGNLYTLWQKNKQNMEGVLEKGEYIVFNGKEFSDADFFKTTDVYKVLAVGFSGVELEIKQGKDRYNIFIHPDGLSSFDKIMVNKKNNKNKGI